MFLHKVLHYQRKMNHFWWMLLATSQLSYLSGECYVLGQKVPEGHREFCLFLNWSSSQGLCIPGLCKGRDHRWLCKSFLSCSSTDNVSVIFSRKDLCSPTAAGLGLSQLCYRCAKWAGHPALHQGYSTPVWEGNCCNWFNSVKSWASAAPTLKAAIAFSAL